MPLRTEVGVRTESFINIYGHRRWAGIEYTQKRLSLRLKGDICQPHAEPVATDAMLALVAHFGLDFAVAVTSCFFCRNPNPNPKRGLLRHRAACDTGENAQQGYSTERSVT